MNNRLNELTQGGKIGIGWSSEESSGNGGDNPEDGIDLNEIRIVPSNEEVYDMDVDLKDEEMENIEKDAKCFNDIKEESDKILVLVRDISTDCDVLRREYRKIMIGSPQDNDRINVRNLRDSISTRMHQLKSELEKFESKKVKLKREILEKRKEDELTPQYRTAEFRMRENTYFSLLIRTQDVITKFQKIQMDQKEAQKERVRRKLRIITGKDDTEEIDEELMLEFMKEPKKIYKRYLLQQGEETKKAMLDEACETREDLLELETRMNELVDMFTDCHELLKLQGENIDSIEDDVVNSIEYTEKGTKSLKQGQKYQRKTKCYCLIAVILSVILGLLIIGITALFIFFGTSLIGAIGGVVAAFA